MGVFGREYNLVEKVNVMRGLMETFAVLYPQLQGIDFRRDVTRLDVPVYMFRGASDSPPGMTSLSSGSTRSTRPASTATGLTTPATLS